MLHVLPSLFYPPADRILVQTRHTDAIKARAACATVGESPEPSPSRQPCLEGLGPHCARGSAATDRPRASAASCAIDSCDATESRCVAKAIHVHGAFAQNPLNTHQTPRTNVSSDTNTAR